MSSEISEAKTGFPPKEIKPIKTDSIYPGSLARFLSNREPTLNFGQKPDYPQIFSVLRSLPAETQKRFLVDFFTKGVRDFPDPNGKHLGEFLAWVNNFLWFKPGKQPDSSLLQKFSDEFLSRLDEEKLPIKIIRNNWHEAWAAEDFTHFSGLDLDKKFQEMRDIEFDEGRSHQPFLKALEMAEGVTTGVISEMTRLLMWGASTVEDPVWTARMGAAWIIVEDLMRQKSYTKGNPGEPLMKIYELGCWPIGIVGQDFVIFVPPVQKSV